MKKTTINIDTVKRFLKMQDGDINLKVNLGRNKFCTYEGQIQNIFPAVFTFKTKDQLKTYSYSQVLCGDVKFKNAAKL